MTGLALDSQFIYIWGCLAVVHYHSVNPDKFYSRCLPCIYVGTGYFENVLHRRRTSRASMNVDWCLGRTSRRGRPVRGHLGQMGCCGVLEWPLTVFMEKREVLEGTEWTRNGTHPGNQEIKI